MAEMDGVQAASVDAEEVARYQRLAAAWWDPKGPFWPLHVLNELRTDWIIRQLAVELGLDSADPAVLSGMRVLDIGCGGGILAESMARRGASVVGIDVTPRNLIVAEQHAEQQGLQIDYRLQSLETLAEEPFDLVLNMEVIEHVVDPQAFLALSMQGVRPGGFLCLATINRTWMAFIVAIFGAEYLLRILPRGTHRWDRFVRPRELETPLAEAGARLVARTGVAVNPLRRKMRETRYEGVNYMLLARMPNEGKRVLS
jgi:2-polyprenyl-6-hydroxyphenyl methylase/3-demethylubiquinone-9 3-methyltransferase